MRHGTRVFPVMAVGLVLSLAPARAERFNAKSDAAYGVVAQRRRDHPHFSFAVYYAQWENPYRLNVSVTVPVIGTPTFSRTVRVVPDTPSSLVYEGTYLLNPRWQLGLWYNPIRGERLKQTVEVADLPVDLNFRRDVDLSDIYVAYRPARGLTAQLGYYREWNSLRGQGPQSGHERRVFTSWNIWVTGQFNVRLHQMGLTPFLAAGYHTSSSLHHALSLQPGVTLAVTPHLDLSGSVWLFDLSHTATRVTGGLTYWF